MLPARDDELVDKSAGLVQRKRFSAAHARSREAHQDRWYRRGFSTSVGIVPGISSATVSPSKEGGVVHLKSAHPAATELPRRLAKHATSMAVTVTVTVTVNRLGSLGPGCASCGLLYGYYEARRVEGWLSMLLRQGRLYRFRSKLMLDVPMLFKSK